MYGLELVERNGISIHTLRVEGDLRYWSPKSSG